MKLNYYIHNNLNEQQIKTLLSNWVNVKPWAFFYFDEQDVWYEIIISFLDKRDIKYKPIAAVFTKEEINSSERLVWSWNQPNWYPQPEEWYQEGVYEQWTYCNHYNNEKWDFQGICGVWWIQKNPFRIKWEPKFNKNKLIFSLEWVNSDAIFVEIGLYNEVFKPLNIDCRPVIINQKWDIAKTVVQLKLPIAEDSLDMKNADFYVCKVCWWKKYSPRFLDFFPIYKKKPKYSIFHTKEYFGFWWAWKNVLINKELYQELLKRKVVKDYWFIPCK